MVNAQQKNKKMQFKYNRHVDILWTYQGAEIKMMILPDFVALRPSLCTVAELVVWIFSPFKLKLPHIRKHNRRKSSKRRKYAGRYYYKDPVAGDVLTICAPCTHFCVSLPRP